MRATTRVPVFSRIHAALGPALLVLALAGCDSLLKQTAPSRVNADGLKVPANAKLLVDGARAAPAEMGGFERTCLLFDGNDERAVEAARADWRAVKAASLPAKYWAQEQGRWVQKAS